MTNLPRKKKFLKKQTNIQQKPLAPQTSEPVGYICIPAHEIKRHHNYLELSDQVQQELNSLFKVFPKSTETNPESMATHRPSPYIVNLKKETKRIKQEQPEEEIITTQEINLLIIPNVEIDNQFTPLYNATRQTYLKQKKIKRKRSFIKLFISIVGLLLIGHLIFSYYTLKNTQRYILDLSQNAFNHINDGYKALSNNNYDSANIHFSLATRQFVDAEKELTDINPLTRQLILTIPGINERFVSGYHSIQAGSRLSLIAKYTTQGLQTIEDEPIFTKKIDEIKDISIRALPLLHESIDHINQVRLDDIPQEKRDIFITIKKQLPIVELGTKNFINLSDFILETIGQDEKKRYLVAFQNNAEIRSSGGFIGSFALLDIYQGRITNLEIPNTGSYQLQGGLQKNIIPPQPLQLIADRWEFQDSNWDADFRNAAQKMEDLFTLSWGPSVDGVFAVNLPVMENLLKILGPIDLPEYNKTLNSDNFWQEVQTSVELEYDKTLNNPKQIITDMTPIILDRLAHSDPTQIFNLLVLSNQSLLEKNIQIYLKDKTSQEIVETYGWSGMIPPQTPGDYQYVVTNNIAGGKTDRVIDQTIYHNSVVEPNGDIINTIKIKRTHNGIKGDNFTGIRNVAYIRVYVPQGSEFISASGWRIPDAKYFKTPIQGAEPDTYTRGVEDTMTVFKPSDTDIYQEYNKTVFGNWSMIDPGETAEITIQYRLPFKLKLPQDENGNSHTTEYHLDIQKQPGTQSTIYTTIELPKNLRLLDKSSDQHIFADQLILKKDKSYSLPISE